MKKELMVKELSLTPLNARKLMKGLPTVIKAEHLKGTGVKVFVHPSKHKKMARAMTKGKGYTLSLDKDELDASTEGGKIDFKKVMKTGLKAVAKPLVKQAVSPLGVVASVLPTDKLVDVAVEKVVGRGKSSKKMKAQPVSKGLPKALQLSGLDGMPDEKGGKIDFKKLGQDIKKGYAKVKPIASPIIKELVKKGIQTGLTAAVSAIPGVGEVAAPIVGVASSKIADVAANELQKKIGFGAPKLQSNYSNFLNSSHPAMNPALPQADNSLRYVETGGSFRSIGSTRRGGSFVSIGQPSRLSGGALLSGTPMNPILDQGDFSLIRKRPRRV